jgi:CheY-like chemotaxis protein
LLDAPHLFGSLLDFAMHADLRILVFGDQESTVDLVLYELSKLSLPCTTVQVNSREAFLRVLEESSPDLILVTYRGSGLEALTFLALAQEVCPGVPFFFINDGARLEAIELREMPPRPRRLKVAGHPAARRGTMTRRAGTC